MINQVQNFFLWSLTHCIENKFPCGTAEWQTSLYAQSLESHGIPIRMSYTYKSQLIHVTDLCWPMAKVKFTVRQRVFIYDSYVITQSTCEVSRWFQDQFPGDKHLSYYWHFCFCARMWVVPYDSYWSMLLSFSCPTQKSIHCNLYKNRLQREIKSNNQERKYRVKWLMFKILAE